MDLTPAEQVAHPEAAKAPISCPLSALKIPKTWELNAAKPEGTELACKYLCKEWNASCGVSVEVLACPKEPGFQPLPLAGESP